MPDHFIEGFLRIELAQPGRLAAREFLFKLFVRANPNPHPDVPIKTTRDRTIIFCYTHRPGPWRIPHSFESQARMAWIRRETTVGSIRRPSNLTREIMIHLPKDMCPARDHAFSSKSLSRIIGNCSGSLRYASSTSSRNFSNLGRGLGSRKIASHLASPSSSGTNFGSDSARRARSASGSFPIASSISSTVLTLNSYNTRRASATPQLPATPC